MSQDTETIKAAARRTLEEIFPTVDEAALAEVVHPDIVNHDAPPGTAQGLEGMTWSMRTLAAAFSDRRWEIHQAIAEGDTVVLHCTFSGRHTGPFMGLAPTNRPFAYRQVHLIRFQDGKGIEHWAARDDLSFLRQVGALPNQAARPVPADA
jgi:predicted ester cyclase